MKLLWMVGILGLVLLAACGKSTEGGKGGPPLDVKVKLVQNEEVAVKDTKLKLTLKSATADAPPTGSIDAKLDTMEVLRVLKPGDFLELGEYKVTLVAVDATAKPSCEVQVLRQ